MNVRSPGAVVVLRWCFARAILKLDSQEHMHGMHFPVRTDGLKQVALPGVPGSMPRAARQDASHNLQQDVRDVEAFSDSQVQSSPELLGHLVPKPNMVRHGPFVGRDCPEDLGVAELADHV